MSILPMSLPQMHGVVTLTGRVVADRSGVIDCGDAMAHYEIILPETKPETEWVRGRPLQKVSPQRTHSRLQGAFTMQLDRWAAGRGEVGPEWRFRVEPPDQMRRPLVPDVAYVSNERLRPLTDDELEMPPLAPDVAVEILSPNDRRVDINDKIGVYLRAGSSLVIVVEPQQRTVELHDNVETVSLDEKGVIEHRALPEFSYPVRELFAVLQRS